MTEPLQVPGEGTVLLVGLGNPGREYRHTRHNVGFMTLDRLAERLGCEFSELKFSSMIARCQLEGRDLILQKPLTYMNLSGQAVRELIRNLRIPIHNILVIHDEIDLPLGRLRFKWDGGTAGHKGLASIVSSLGTNEFSRLRIGILNADKRRIDVRSYVLQPFSPEEMSVLDEVLEGALEGIVTFCLKGLREAMNSFNGFQVTI